MSMRFDGRVVIVTGGGQGIGRAIARRFGADGATVVIAERNTEQGENVAREITSEGGTAEAITTDVSQADQVQAMVDATLQRHGQIDVLVNNAGLTFMSGIGSGRFDELSLEEWNRVI